jgi:hypothetical protein
LPFGIACGLLAEAVEVLHIQAGGMAPPGLSLRGALVVAYGLVGAALFGVALLLSRRRALAMAATGFALFAILPWLNFSVLPRFGSVRSLLGNAAVGVLLGVLVPLLTRLPRTLLGAIAVLVIGVNVRTLGGAGGGGTAGNAVDHASQPLNVVVVLIDTLRADHLGAYGYPLRPAPTSMPWPATAWC